MYTYYHYIMQIKNCQNGINIILKGFVFLLIIMSIQSYASTVYYVDATNGNDNNSGLSPASAWRNISRVNATSFSPSDTILFKRDEIWREQLVVASSGSQGSPITFGVYGTGDAPVISGADLITDWSQETSNVWSAHLSITPNDVEFDGVVGNEQSDISQVNSNHDWYYRSGISKIYVYSTSDPDTAYTHFGIEAYVRDYCIKANGKNFITYQDLELESVRGACLKHEGNSSLATDISLYNLEVHHAAPNGYANHGTNPVGIQIDAVSNLLIKNCSAHDCGWNGIVVNNKVGSVGISNIVIDTCIAHHNVHQGFDMKAGATSGGDITDITIQYCASYNNEDNGFYFQNGTSGTISGVDMHYNLSFGNGGHGCYFNCYNQSYSHHVDIYNNVFYGNGTRLAGTGLHADLKSSNIKNNVIFNNQANGDSERELSVNDGGGTECSCDYNLIYHPSHSTIIQWNSKYWRYSQFTGNGYNINGLNEDSYFTNADRADFTLRGDSSCINAGFDVDLSQDFEGKTVPLGGAADIGAFEYADGDHLNVDIDASVTLGWIPLTVNFSSSVTGGQEPYEYSWNFGDGHSSTEQNPSHTFASAREYEVTCTVTDSSENQGFDSITIEALANTGDIILSIDSKTGAPAPGSGGTTSPSPGIYSYAAGASVPISAIHNTDYRFSMWTGNVGSSNAYDKNFTLIMDTSKSISASFCTKCGDISGDLTVTPADAQFIFDIYLGRTHDPTRCQLENADVNCDGTKDMPNITPYDAQFVFEKFLGLGDLPSDCSNNARADSVASTKTFEGHTEHIELTIPIHEDNFGEEIAIPLTIESAVKINAIGFDLEYPSDILKFINLSRAELTKDFCQLEGYERNEGEVRVGGYSSQTTESRHSGELMFLIFKIIKRIDGQITLSIKNPVDDFQKALVLDDIAPVSISSKKVPHF